MKTVLSLLAIVALTGCVTPNRPRPELTMDGTSAAQVKNAALTWMTGEGWLPASADSVIMTFEKDLPFGVQLFVQELGAQPAKNQFMLTLLETTNRVRMLGRLRTVTTRFGAPQFHENYQQDVRIQWYLESIRALALSLSMPTNPIPVMDRAVSIHRGNDPFRR